MINPLREPANCARGIFNCKPPCGQLKKLKGEIMMITLLPIAHNSNYFKSKKNCFLLLF
jgi:hypothetical protein